MSDADERGRSSSGVVKSCGTSEGNDGIAMVGGGDGGSSCRRREDRGWNRIESTLS